MPTTLSRPLYWLVAALEWPDAVHGDYAECALAIAPSFIPDAYLPTATRDLRRLVCALRPSDDVGEVVFFADVTGFLRREGHDWADMGISDWEATKDELFGLPIPSMYLSLSRYGHTLLCTAGEEVTYAYDPDTRALTEIPRSSYDELRAGLRARLHADWPAYIARLEAQGKLQQH